MIHLDPTKIAFHPTAQLVNDLGGGFHATSIRNIHGIINDGILPGGPQGSRLSTHFGVYAPWDPRNRVTKCRVPGEHHMPLLVLYVPSYVLINCGANISDNGVYLISRPIPFEQVRDAWIAIPQRSHRWKFREVRKILSESLENEIVENVNGTYDPDGAYYDATPAKVKEILLSLNPGPHASERDQLVAELDAGDRSNNLKRRCVAMCSRHYSSTTNAASQREPLKLRVCPQCMHETPTKLAICHHCLAIFDCVGRKEYINVQEDAAASASEDISEGALQRAQAEATAEVETAIETESTVGQPEEHDQDDRMTEPEPDAESLEHDEEMVEEADRQDANEDRYEDHLLTDNMRGILQINHDVGINLLHARAIDALAIRLYEGDWYLANYDSSQVATQFMDCIFCGLIYDFWLTFTRFHRLPYPAMLARFKDGSRHDALGLWPVVELDGQTGLPRDLTEAEIIEHTHKEDQKQWRHKKYKIQKMLSIAVRGCVALGYERARFNIKDHPVGTVRATMHVTMSRILKCVFGAKAYSYFRGELNHIPDHLHIDPSAMLAAQPAKETLTETLVMVQSYGYEMPPDCECKFQGYLRDKSRRPSAEMKILPIEYWYPDTYGRQQEPRTSAYAAAASSSMRPTGHPGPYSGHSGQWPKRAGRGNRWNRG